MGLEAKGAVREEEAGGWESQGEADNGASGEGRDDGLDDTSGTDGSRGLAVTSGGDETRKSGRNTGASKYPDGTG